MKLSKLGFKGRAMPCRVKAIRGPYRDQKGVCLKLEYRHLAAEARYTVRFDSGHTDLYGRNDELRPLTWVERILEALGWK